MKRRSFLTKTAIGLGAGALAYKWYGDLTASEAKGKIVIVGGGAAGITMAAYLTEFLKHPDITIIEPSKEHHYQPGYTMMAARWSSPTPTAKSSAGVRPRRFA